MRPSPTWKKLVIRSEMESAMRQVNPSGPELDQVRDGAS